MSTRKIVVIHQPDFIPYLGFFHRLTQADCFIVLDHVRMSKRGWVHRDKIKTASGEAWLTVPIKGLDQSPEIRSAKIDYNNLFGRIPRIIEANYQKAPFFKQVFPLLLAVFEKRPEYLLDLNMQLLTLLFDWFDIQVPTIRSSELGIATHKSQMNADLVKSVGGDTYLSGVGAKDYHDQTCFDTLGIAVEWQKFSHPEYPQEYGEFLQNLSCIDLLFNCGITASGDLLRRSQ